MEPQSEPPRPPRVPPLWKSPSPSPPPLPTARRRSRWAEWIGSLGVIGTLLLSFGGKLKFLLPLLKFLGPALKTGGTMLLSIGVYALAFGWKFAVGFVLLIFVHEMGHVFAARQAGIAVTAPTFIPFIGAHILIKQAMPGAWVEAKIGYGGPLAGAWASALCHWIWLETGNPFWAALAYTGYFLNLFNLAPVSPLDGGRITAAISPWLWVLGFVLLSSWLVWDLYQVFHGGRKLGAGIFVMGMILVSGLPRLFSLFRPKSEHERRYFSVSPQQRIGMSLAYFGLIGLLAWGMAATHVAPEGL
jgi:Zn-dependent protease